MLRSYISLGVDGMACSLSIFRFLRGLDMIYCDLYQTDFKIFRFFLLFFFFNFSPLSQLITFASFGFLWTILFSSPHVSLSYVICRDLFSI